MITRDQYERGVAVEREHLGTYTWLLKEIQRGHTPKPAEFFLHIAHDHLLEDSRYYEKLATIEAD